MIDKDILPDDVTYENAKSRDVLPFICDYCGRKFERLKKSAKLYRKVTDKDSCGDRKCMRAKMGDSCMRIYGVPNAGALTAIDMTPIRESFDKEIGFKRLEKRTLAEVHPEIAAKWHKTKNGTLTAHDVAPKSWKKVWWQCPEAEDHEWEAAPANMTTNNNRNRGGCPCCDGRKVVGSNCLKTLYPDIAAELHDTKNGEITPENITAKSQKRLWWRCQINPEHEWQSGLPYRINGSQCPFCDNKIATSENNLKITHPHIAAQWHPTLNGKLKPEDVLCNSSKMVWWQCPKEEDHVWKCLVRYRTISDGTCSCCIGKVLVPSNTLQNKRPDVASEWHPTKNGDLTPSDVAVSSGKVVWWKCDKDLDHEWEATVANRTYRESKCPCCSGAKCVPSNSIGTTHPNMIKEWDYEKNYPMTPYDITHGSSLYVWWKCSKHGSWKAQVSNRIGRSSGCPSCSQSKGEKIIAEILANMGIGFERQRRFESCRNKNPLPFDFVVSTKNDLKAIEFYGQQHYEPVNFAGNMDITLSRHKDLLINDCIKTEWCKSHNIPLLIIPFTEIDKMDTIIKMFVG